MILSISRKTDIPAFYSKWLFERLKQGFCYVQNPMNAKQVSKILINPDTVSGAVFWTKNPEPMLPHLKKIPFPFYFHFSLNPYAQDMEVNLPKKNVLIKTFKQLSSLTSPRQVIWRYDPIVISNNYPVDYHIKHFELLAKQLQGYSHQIIFSFMDFYKKNNANCLRLGVRTPSLDEKKFLAKNLAEIANLYNFSMASCAEEIELENYGIKHSSCINRELLEKISGKIFDINKDKGQRQACACVQSVDIGMYNSCSHACQYCYASHSQKSVLSNMKKHDPFYPLLIGQVGAGVEIKEKTTKKKTSPDCDKQYSLL